MKARYRIYESVGHDNPFSVTRAKEEDGEWLWSRKKVTWWSCGAFKTLEEAEDWIKKDCTPPLQYDEKGNRL